MITISGECRYSGVSRGVGSGGVGSGRVGCKGHCGWCSRVLRIVCFGNNRDGVLDGR